MTTLKPSQLLADPANWCKGSRNYSSRTGPCCVMGAMRRVTDTDPAFWRMRDRFKSYLGTDNLLEWNDAPERTHAEVIAALMACNL